MDKYADLKSVLCTKKLFKITNETECHHGFQYADGLNILVEDFSETDLGVPSGFNFTDAEHIIEYLGNSWDKVYLREVYLPFDDPELKIAQNGYYASSGEWHYIGKWRTNKLCLGKRHNLFDTKTFDFLAVNGSDLHVHGKSLIPWAICKKFIDLILYLRNKGVNIGNVYQEKNGEWVTSDGYYTYHYVNMNVRFKSTQTNTNDSSGSEIEYEHMQIEDSDKISTKRKSIFDDIKPAKITKLGS